MITLGWPLGLALAAGAVVPVALHLLQRTRWRSVPWPAMRLLADVATRHGSRLALEDLLLLLVRVLLICAVALTIARPQWAEPVAAEHRRGRVAAAVLIDDGLPSGIREQRTTRLAQQQQLATAYLASLVAGDEVSVLAGSAVGSPLSDPLLDLDAARRQVNAVQPTATTPDLPSLIAAGLARLDRQRNDDAELVIVTTGCTAGMALDDEARWADLAERVKRGRRSGWRRPRVVLLAPPAAAADLTDWSVSDLAVDQPLPLPDVPLGIRVTVQRSGVEVVPAGLTVRLAVDGRTVAETAVPPLAGHEVVLRFSATFIAAGGHTLEARLVGARDPLPIDDRRCISIEVAQRVPVLLVERVAGDLELVAAALDPGDGSDQRSPFAIRRITAAALDAEALLGVRAVVMGDIDTLEPAATAALERVLTAGGGVLVGCGPHATPELVMAQWFRGGDGLLAAALDGAEGADTTGGADFTPRHPRPAAGDLPALGGGGLRAADQAPAWAAATVHTTRRVLPGQWQTWVELDDGAPLVVAAHRGQGLAVLWLTTLDERWTDLPFHALWVPLVRGVVGTLAAAVLPTRNLHPGDALAWPCPGGVADPTRAVLTAPDGTGAVVRPGGWDGAPALVAGPLREPGIWQMRPVAAGDGPAVPYAVAIDPAALDVTPVAFDRLRARVATTGCSVVAGRTIDDVKRITALSAEQRSRDFTPWCAAVALLLLFAELLFAWRLHQRSAP